MRCLFTACNHGVSLSFSGSHDRVPEGGKNRHEGRNTETSKKGPRTLWETWESQFSAPARAGFQTYTAAVLELYVPTHTTVKDPTTATNVPQG